MDTEVGLLNFTSEMSVCEKPVTERRSKKGKYIFFILFQFYVSSYKSVNQLRLLKYLT